jgi:plasmid stability protein
MKKPAFPSDQQDKFMLRLPDGMRERIKAKAEENGRSMNSEIVDTLERAYPVATDTMYLVIDKIRQCLEEYEMETDPSRRLWLQMTVEGLAGGYLTMDEDRD